MKTFNIVRLLLIVIVIIGSGLYISNKQVTKIAETKTTPSGTSASQKPDFDKNLYPINNANSLWVVVNKGRQLPSDYVPADLVSPSISKRPNATSEELLLRSDAASDLEQLFKAAQTDGYSLMMTSGYRSYTTQKSLYATYVSQSGVALADTFSARTGHSEHQTGLAVDISPANRKCELDKCFAETAEGIWVAGNAYKYGFVVRYQDNKTSITGYSFEPWHLRYVGNDLARQLYDNSQTLEELFELQIYTSYPADIFQLKS